MNEVITSILIFLGTFFTLLSAIGVLRLRDVYSRMHTAGKSSTLGVIFLMFAVVVYFLPETFNAKILLAIIFIFMTAPLSALVINRSAYRLGVPLEKNTGQDDLKEMYEKKR